MRVKDLQIKLKSLVTDIVDDQLLNDIGKEVTSMVKTRTRKGYGVATEKGPQQRLKGLSESYKKQRIRLARNGKLSSETTPNKSNLTKTGKMIDSVDYKVANNEVTIGPIGAKNKMKAKYQAKAGRIAFNISKSENKRILKMINDKIKTDINKKGL